MGIIGGGTGPEINVTPLIDVLLVLVIMFLIITPFQHQKGLEANIPQPPTSDSPPPPDRTIVIQISSAKIGRPTIKINQDDVQWDDLARRLTQIFIIRVEKVAFVKADADVEFANVADVIDIAHNAGVQRVGLLTNTNTGM